MRLRLMTLAGRFFLPFACRPSYGGAAPGSSSAAAGGAVAAAGGRRRAPAAAVVAAGEPADDGEHLHRGDRLVEGHRLVRRAHRLVDLGEERAPSRAGEAVVVGIGAGRGPRPPRLHAERRGAPVASARAAPRRPSRAPRRPRARRQAASIALSCLRTAKTRRRRPPRGGLPGPGDPRRLSMQPRSLQLSVARCSSLGPPAAGRGRNPHTPAAARYKVPASQEPGARRTGVATLDHVVVLRGGRGVMSSSLAAAPSRSHWASTSAQ